MLQRFCLPLALLVGLLFAVACQSGAGGGTTATGPAAPVAASSTGVNTSGGMGMPPAAAAGRMLSTHPARTFTYANLQATVTRGAITSGAAGKPGTMDLTLAVSNPTDGSLDIRDGQLQVTLKDGTTAQTPLRLIVDIRATTEEQVSLEVPPTATWAGAQLRFGEPGHEPAVLSLDGPAPASPYPTPLTVSGEARVAEAEMGYQALSGKLDLDAGGQRAATGQRFLSLQARVSTTARYAANVSTDDFRLVVDGKPLPAAGIDPCCEAVALGKDKEFQVVFAIPSATTTATLEVGESGKGTARIALDLKPAPR